MQTTIPKTKNDERKSKKKPRKAVSAPELFEYIELPKVLEPPFVNESLDIQELFQTCNSELGLQQSKRDQLIAFYLTISGIVSGYAFASDTSLLVRAGIFAMLALLGFMWCIIILRYRIYKETYWISCRVINSLFAVDCKKINKAVIQHNFYLTMLKCMRWSLTPDKTAVSMKKLIKANMRSAELLMYLTLRLLTAFSCAMAIYSLFLSLGFAYVAYIVSPAVFLAVIIIGIWQYNRQLCKYYAVICDHSKASFNKVFEKAWQLHIFCS